MTGSLFANKFYCFTSDGQLQGNIVKIIFTLLDYFQTILLIKISHNSAILENMSILYMTKIVLGLPVLTE